MAINLMTAFDGLVVPTRSDPDNFPARGDDMMSRFPTWQQQMNIITPQINATAIASAAAQVAAEAARDASAASATSSAASAASAAAAAGVTKWVTGTNYAQGAQTWSPTDFMTYRAKVALNPSNTDPAADTANWAPALERPFSAMTVLSIAADTSLSATSKNVIRVASTVKGSSLLLPDATTLAGRNGMYPVKNVGSLALLVRDQSGVLLAVMPAGASALFTLEDASTAAGTWAVLCPESKPGNITGAATVAATTPPVVQISAIPGTTNKAVILYGLSVRIATLNTDGSVSLGAVCTLPNGGNVGFGDMICAMSATAAICATAASTPAYYVYSLTLDTVANTVTASTGATLSFSSPNAMFDPCPVALDATRVAWMAGTTGAVGYIIVATHGGAGNPTSTVRTVTSEIGGDRANGMVGIGGGSLLAVGNVAAILYTSSGNTLTVASTLAQSGLYQTGSGTGNNTYTWTRLFSPAAGKAAILSGSFTAGGAASLPFDRCLGLSWTGTTLAGAYSASGSFNSQISRQDSGDANYLGAFAAGSGYGLFAAGDAATSSPSLRIMRASGDLLTEVAFGAPEGCPLLSATVGTRTSLRVAAVNGQKCIAVGSARNGNPIIMGLEVIKA